MKERLKRLWRWLISDHYLGTLDFEVVYWTIRDDLNEYFKIPVWFSFRFHREERKDQQHER